MKSHGAFSETCKADISDTKAPDDYLDEEYVDLDWQPPADKQPKVDIKRSQNSHSQTDDFEGSGEAGDDDLESGSGRNSQKYGRTFLKFRLSGISYLQ